MMRIVSLLLILTAVFAGSRALVRALPGDPIETLIAESGTAIQYEVIAEELSLNKPFWAALVDDSGRALRGDFGLSILSRQPVTPLVLRRFFATIQLALAALVLGLPVSMVLGLLAAGMPGGTADRVCTFHGAISAALPTPWVGPILLVTFAVWIPVFPLGGHIALPAITLALGFSGLWARLIRERVRETLFHGAAPGARARGVPEWKVLLKYGLMPGAGALTAYLGTQVGGLMAGAFVTEVIFDWKGIGSLLVESVLKRDYPIIECAVFFTAAASLLGNFLGDAASDIIDPRSTLQ